MGIEPDDGMLWDIACPRRPFRVPGVAMAGFRDRGITPPGLRLIPHPAVTMVLVFDGTIGVEDAIGRQQQGSFAAGPGLGDVLQALRVDTFEALQVRLSPVVAHAVLGTALDSAVVALDDVLGRETARLGAQLGELSSWQDRFAWAGAWIARRWSHLHRDVVEFTGLTPATVVDEPFLQVDDVAWGWPRPPRGPGHTVRSVLP